jgi:hypothetical protein
LTQASCGDLTSKSPVLPLSDYGSLPLSFLTNFGGEQHDLKVLN